MNGAELLLRCLEAEGVAVEGHNGLEMVRRSGDTQLGSE